MNWHWFIAPGSALYLIPLAAMVGIGAALAAPAARRPIITWWIALAIACLLTAASKIAFYGWGTGIRAWDLTCFSGHAVMAFAVWPVAMMLGLPPRRPGWRLGGVLAGTALAGLVAYSRVRLGAHPTSEVLAGILLGGLAGGLGVWALRHQGLPMRLAPVLLGLLIVALILPGRRLPTLPSEQWFAAAGTALSGRETPFSRKKWRSVKGIINSRSVDMGGSFRGVIRMPWGGTDDHVRSWRAVWGLHGNDRDGDLLLGGLERRHPYSALTSGGGAA